MEMLYAFLNRHEMEAALIRSRTATDAVIDSENEWTSGWSVGFEGEIKLLPQPLTEQMFLGHPACSLFTILTEPQGLVCFKIFCNKFLGSSPLKNLGKCKREAKPCTGLLQALRFSRGWSSQISGKSQGCQPNAPAAFTPQEIHLVLISVRG